MKTEGKKEGEEMFQESNPVTFFGVEETVENAEAFISKDLVEETSEESEEEEEEEVTFFAKDPEEAFEVEEEEEEDDEEEEGVDPENKKDKRKANKSSSTSFQSASLLLEKGLIVLDEGEELTEENAEELLENSWDRGFDTAIDEMVADLPDRAKKFLKFVSNGGDPDEFLDKMASNVKKGITKNSDRDDEATLERALKMKLADDGYDAEEIEDQIEALKSADKFTKIGQKAFDNILAKQEDEEEAEVLTAKERLAEKKKVEKVFKEKVSSFVGKIKEAKGLTLSPKDKQELPKYISEPAVTLNNGSTLTQLQVDFFETIASNDPEKLVALAKVMKSDFDLSSFAKKVITDETRNNIKANANRGAGKKQEVEKVTGARKFKDLADRL